jgi:hypothetical protein
MAEIQAHGLAVSTPAGWEGRIFRRPASDEVRGSATDGSVAGAPAPTGEVVSPVLHAATIPLAADVADYASDAVDQLGPTDVIVVLKEFDPSETAYALFAPVGLPRDLDPDWFGPASLQRTLPGQAGLQRFFQENGRAFCLYVVLGAYARRNDIVPAVNAVLTTIRIEAVGPSRPTTPSTTTPSPSSTGGPDTVPTTTPTTTGPTTSAPAGTAPAPGPGPTTTTGPDPSPATGGAPR